MIRVPRLAEFFQKMRDGGYEVFDSAKAPYNLNIVGWRNVKGLPDEFSDFLAVYFLHPNHRWEARLWRASTRPGVPWLRLPLNKKGTAILKPGQYRGAYRLGKFKWHDALLQVEPVKVWRDDDRDDVAEPLKDDEGLFGIHIHRAGIATKVVGRSSAGCQVTQYGADFDAFIGLCRQASMYWGDRYTYTLLEF